MKTSILQKLREIFGIDQVSPPQHGMPALSDPYMEGVIGWYNRTMQMGRDRRSVYYDMEQIGDFVLGASALEMYTEDAFPFNQERSATIWVSSPNGDIIKAINDLNRRIDIETLIPSMSYTTSQYGDDFEYLAIGKEGVQSIRQIQPHTLTRIEDQYSRLLGFTPGLVDYIPGRDTTIPTPLSRPWDVLHTRLCSSYTRITGHGTSMLMPVRYIWRQLKIMMDAMVLYRWTRGPDRMVYYIDVGTNSPEQQMRILNQWKLYIKKKQNFNPNVGNFDQEWNPESIDEDIFWPVSKNSNSKIERLQGASNVSDIADVQMYVNLFFAGLRIPKAFMGFEGEIMAREVLPYQSIRYANVAYKLQRAVLASLSRLYQIHLTILGLDVTQSENSFKVHTSTISHLYDVAKSELLQAKMEIMRNLLEFGDMVQFDKGKWLDYILRTYLDMDDAMIRSVLTKPQPEQGMDGLDGDGSSSYAGDEGEMDMGDEEELAGEDESQPISDSAKRAIDRMIAKKPESLDGFKNLRKMAPFFNPSVDSRNTAYEEIVEAVCNDGENDEFHKGIRTLIEKSLQSEKKKEAKA